MRRGFGATWVCDLVHCSESFVASDLFAVRFVNFTCLARSCMVAKLLAHSDLFLETKSGTVHSLAFRGSLLKLTVGLIELNG
jgi:hypothetical protein